MILFRQLGYVFARKQRFQMAGLFFLQFIETIMDFFSLSLILPFVSILTNMDNLQDSGWYKLIASIIGSNDSQDVLLFLTFAMMGLYVFKNAFALFLTNLRVKFLSTNQIRMGAKMIRCYMHKPYTFHLQRNSAQIVRNVNADVGGAFSVISALFNIVSDALIILMLLFFLFAVDTTMTLTVMAGLVVCSALYFLIVRKKIREAGELNRKYSAKMIKAIQQAMGGIKEVKVMGREQYFSDVYREAGTLQVERKRKYTVLATIPGKLIETVCMSSLLILIAYKIASGADLSSLVPGLSGFAVAALRLLPRTNSINSHINSITYNRPSLDALYNDLTESDRLDAERQREIEEKRKHKAPKTKSEDIVLKHISYTYPNAAAPVLSDINLRIPHGSSVGVVGTTGAGKTTLVDIILGLLKPQDGTVHYGSLDIHEDYARWQEHIGYIPQNIYLTDDSIRKNVALGVPDEEIREADVWRALEHAQLADFVRSLPEGLDTVIGERGVRISGGQRQRIGIARALYRDPEILFFDEATSSLDNETESAVMDAINTIGKSKTMVIVAHRLTTIEKCDLIFRVENGQVQETKL